MPAWRTQETWWGTHNPLWGSLHPIATAFLPRTTDQLAARQWLCSSTSYSWPPITSKLTTPTKQDVLFWQPLTARQMHYEHWNFAAALYMARTTKWCKKNGKLIFQCSYPLKIRGCGSTPYVGMRWHYIKLIQTNFAPFYFWRTQNRSRKEDHNIFEPCTYKNIYSGLSFCIK